MTDTPQPLPVLGAPLWRRLMALVYDSFLLGAVTMAYGALVTLLLVVLQGDTTAGEYRPMILSDWGNRLFLVGLMVSLAGFYVFFWCRGGQTAGMRAWRLRVVQAGALPETRSPGLRQALRRATLAPLCLLAAGAGYWWRSFDAGGDCLHDRWSGTRVILTPALSKQR